MFKKQTAVPNKLSPRAFEGPAGHTDGIVVEICYAAQNRQAVFCLRVAPNTTARQAIEASGVLRAFSEIDLGVNPIGIFSKRCTPDTVLLEHDRVEIYRALLADPKVLRRKRAMYHGGVDGSRSKVGKMSTRP